MTLPADRKVDARVLSNIFNNTVATYKYYWFVSLLDIVVKEQRRQISFWEIIVGMIAEAWYPIHYFRLSFGKSDSMYKQIVALQKELNIPVDAGKDEIKRQIISNLNNPAVTRILRVFTLNVPYRFLSPWINYTTDAEVVRLSQSFTNHCIYRIKDETIELNPLWEQYLNDNYRVLRDFVFWNLTVFLQKRNPNVPDVSSKLVKPILRDSLKRQRNYWNSFIDISGAIRCIYTGRPLSRSDFDLDHFVPWSFVSHNLLWNLLPANPGINSSKSNNLPPLETYLQPFAELHRKAIRALYPVNPNNRLLEDYLIIYDSVSELAQLPDDAFYGVFRKTFTPMVQIAENMGFRYWQNSFPL